MRTNLVVADASRTQKTICLAVSPALKSYGLPGRLRLFEVEQRVKDINYDRRQKNGGRSFRGKSWNKEELERDPFLELDYIVAVPRMAYYMVEKFVDDAYKCGFLKSKINLDKIFTDSVKK